MGRKNQGFSNALSLILSVVVLVLSCSFKNNLSSGVSSALLSLVDIAMSTKEVDELDKNENEKEINGFGNGDFTGSKTIDTSVPDDIKKLMENAVGVYANLNKTGKIKEEQFTHLSANTVYKNIAINNKTETKKVNIKDELSKKASFGKITKEKPYILIYHTHTTEGYEMLDKGFYSNDYNSRTKDVNKTVVRVGDEITKRLEKAGFKVIHDTTIYDANYNGAYSRSLVAVEKYLKKYPSIVVTLDVHRDAIHYDGKVKSKPTATINGKKAAQVMIITGAEEGDIENYPNWSQNLTFAIALQKTIEENYKGLMRPIFFCQRKYNMNVTPCSLLLEMGTDANTLDEAVYSGRLIGDSLAELLEENM